MARPGSSRGEDQPGHDVHPESFARQFQRRRRGGRGPTPQPESGIRSSTMVSPSGPGSRSRRTWSVPRRRRGRGVNSQATSEPGSWPVPRRAERAGPRRPSGSSRREPASKTRRRESDRARTASRGTGVERGWSERLEHQPGQDQGEPERERREANIRSGRPRRCSSRQRTSADLASVTGPETRRRPTAPGADHEQGMTRPRGAMPAAEADTRAVRRAGAKTRSGTATRRAYCWERTARAIEDAGSDPPRRAHGQGGQGETERHEVLGVERRSSRHSHTGGRQRDDQRGSTSSQRRLPSTATHAGRRSTPAVSRKPARGSRSRPSARLSAARATRVDRLEGRVTARPHGGPWWKRNGMPNRPIAAMPPERNG